MITVPRAAVQELFKAGSSLALDLPHILGTVTLGDRRKHLKAMAKDELVPLAQGRAGKGYMTSEVLKEPFERTGSSLAHLYKFFCQARKTLSLEIQLSNYCMHGATRGLLEQLQFVLNEIVK